MKPPLSIRRAQLFRTVWRTNGISRLTAGRVAALCAVVGLIIGLVSLIVNLIPRSNGVPVASESKLPEAKAPVKWTLGKVETVRGTPWRMLAQSEPAPRSSFRLDSYSDYAGETRNYLFLNTTDLQRHFLLPASDAIFLGTERLGEGTASSKKPVRWIEYHLVRTDTNEDEHLDRQDRFDIAYSDAAGKQFGICLSGVEDVLGAEMQGTDTRLVIYRKQGGTFATLLNLKTRRVLRHETLPTSSSLD